MKNSNQTLQFEGSAELQARKAIQRIIKMMEENYPAIASDSKDRLLIECLIEASEERKFLSSK